MAWSAEQLANARAIYAVGQQVGASLRDIRVALMAAIVESGLRNLDYGDRDSIGLFQQRDAWGARADRLDPYKSARMFFLGGAAGQRGLLDFESRASMSLGQAAQAVQVSAYPDRYAEHEAEASAILKGIDPSAVAGDPGTLGAVQGLAEVQPDPATPDAPHTEVNGVGAVTADETGIGALTFGEGGSNPLDALTFGMAPMTPAPTPDGGGSGGDGGGVFMPTLSDLGITQNPDGSYTQTPAGTGEVFYGTFEGKSPTETTTIDGETVDYLTAAALEAATKEFGSGFSIMQGGHSDYAASGGTHHGLGVVDLSVPNGDWAGAVAALRKIGFAAWVRNVSGYSSAGDGAHIHAVLIGNEGLSPEAQTQVQSYLNNDNGLEGSAPDDGPRDWVNNRFTWGDVPKPDPHDHERKTVAAQAAALLGTPFKWGGEDYRGLDDVGLVRKVYRSVDVDVPRLAFNLAYSAEPEPVETAKLGDLIAWNDGSSLGIYAGDGMVIHGSPGASIQLNYISTLGHAWSIPVPKLARRQTYPGGSSPYVPPPVSSPAAPTYNPEAPASQAPTPSGGGNNNGGNNGNDDAPDPRVPDFQM